MAITPSKIVGPAIFMATKQTTFEFPRAVQNQTGLPYELQWVQLDNTPYDLTGATVTASLLIGTTKIPITGTITVTTPVQGIFTYKPSAADTQFAGNLTIQFIATDGADIVFTFPLRWVIEDNIT